MATGVGYITSVAGTNSPNPLILTNGEFLRKINVSSWNKLRVAVRYGFLEYSATAPTGTPRLYIGLCNYNRGGIASKNGRPHFVGMRTVDAAWTRDVGPPINLSPGAQTLLRVGSTFTGGTRITCTLIASLPSTFCMMSVDINKTTPASTVVSSFFTSNAITGGANVTPATFLAQVEAATPSLTGYTLTANTAISVDEATNGALDCVNVYWSRSQTQIWISDIYYSIIS